MGRLLVSKVYLDACMKAWRARLTPEGYDQMFADQGGLCAICRLPPGKRRLHVDHCRMTGRVRGLLCHDCNTGLYKFQDSAAVLQAAIAYKET